MRMVCTLDSGDAERALAEGRRLAGERGLEMGFAVVDRAGELIACFRTTGAPPRVLRHAMRKARTAAVMGRDTARFALDLQERGGSLEQWGDPELTTLVGGVVVHLEGAVAGAVGCGGAPTEIDAEIAQAMADAAARPRSVL